MKKFFLLALVLSSLVAAGISHAANYYVNPSGSGGDGLTDATAFKTISQAQSALSGKSGNNLYFKCGSVWSSGLYIDWSNGVIGAYYMDGSTPVVGVSGSRPVFDGQMTRPGQYGKLIHVYHVSNVIIQDLEVKNAGPLTVMGPVLVEFNGAQYGTVRRCYIHNSTDFGILFENGSDHGTIQNNEVAETQLNVLDGGNGSGNYGSAIQIRGSDDTLVTGNYVHGTGGEGISEIWGCDGATIEKNTVVDGGTAGIYMHSSKNITIRYNLVYDTTETRYRVWGTPGWGIMVGSEESEYCSNYDTNHYIYGNLVADTLVNLGSLNVWGNCTPTNTVIVNNTSVNGTTGVSTNGSPTVRNNIVWGAGTAFSGTSGSNNLTSDPKLSKTSGWSSLTAGSLRGPEFALQSDSPARGSGASLGSPYTTLLDLANADFVNHVLSTITNSANDIGAGPYEAGTTPSCGDGSCNGDETYVTCPADCPAPPETDYITDVPGRVQAEDYGTGGEGVDYHDTEAENLGGKYRNDGVDIETCTDTGGGYNVGYFAPGEWFNVYLNVTSEDDYYANTRIACGWVGTKRLKLTIDGGITSTLSFTWDDGWQTWHSVELPLGHLTTGSHHIKIENNLYAGSSGEFNINYLDIYPSGSDSTTPTLSELHVPNVPTRMEHPSYSFHSSEAGTIIYGGSCNATLYPNAIAGVNDIVFDFLPPGTYSDCTIQVVDAAGNASSILAISQFNVEPYIGPARIVGSLIGGMQLLMGQ